MLGLGGCGLKDEDLDSGFRLESLTGVALLVCFQSFRFSWALVMGLVMSLVMGLVMGLGFSVLQECHSRRSSSTTFHVRHPGRRSKSGSICEASTSSTAPWHLGVGFRV